MVSLMASPSSVRERIAGVCPIPLLRPAAHRPLWSEPPAGAESMEKVRGLLPAHTLIYGDFEFTD
jgi:hypothetical protein